MERRTPSQAIQPLCPVLKNLFPERWVLPPWWTGMMWKSSLLKKSMQPSLKLSSGNYQPCILPVGSAETTIWFYPKWLLRKMSFILIKIGKSQVFPLFLFISLDVLFPLVLVSLPLAATRLVLQAMKLWQTRSSTSSMHMAWTPGTMSILWKFRIPQLLATTKFRSGTGMRSVQMDSCPTVPMEQ